MGIRFQTEIRVNFNAIIKDCVINVPRDELKREIRNIVLLWAERRLLEDGWPLPNSTKAIREYLMDNGIISAIEDEDLNNW